MFFQFCVRATVTVRALLIQWDLVQKTLKVQSSNSVGVCEQKNGRVPKGNDKSLVSCHNNFTSAEEPQQERTPRDDKFTVSATLRRMSLFSLFCTARTGFRYHIHRYLKTSAGRCGMLRSAGARGIHVYTYTWQQRGECDCSRLSL